MIRSKKRGEKKCNWLIQLESPKCNLFLWLNKPVQIQQLPNPWTSAEQAWCDFRQAWLQQETGGENYTSVRWRRRMCIKRFSFNILHRRDTPPEFSACREMLNSGLHGILLHGSYELCALSASPLPPKFYKNPSLPPPSIKQIWMVC